ncbi:unnamed protein product [Toxocara canis]|uniref:Protein UBASH3A-like protein n=1 Tax=Toxocara canis TaxID=6265 RepID=A0A3P7GL19_TOXCA|nr:unnamed protein product [Toxocara canis]
MQVLFLCENPAGFQDVTLLKETYAEIDTNYLPIYSRDELDYAYERYRSDWVCLPRIRHTIDRIINKYSGQFLSPIFYRSLLIVSHGAVIGAIHEVLIGKWRAVGQATAVPKQRERRAACLEFNSDSNDVSIWDGGRMWGPSEFYVLAEEMVKTMN